MPVLLPIRRLMNHCNPFARNCSPWGSPVLRSQIRASIAAGRLVAEPGTDDHAGRIAWLVEHPAEDAIEVDVGVPVLGYWVDWMVTDGNHRLAAAIFAGKHSILAGVSGQLDYAQRLFGVDCTEASS